MFVALPPTLLLLDLLDDAPSMKLFVDETRTVRVHLKTPISTLAQYLKVQWKHRDGDPMVIFSDI
jgi:hypothetical protein